MADRLIIVESPAKAGTIKKFLGGNTKVVASMGHIRDLPKSKLGIDIERNFEPEYINIRGKGDLIKSLKDDAKKRLPINVGFISTKTVSPDDEQDQVSRMQREISRLENENNIMKKRLKKLLNIND